MTFIENVFKYGISSHEASDIRNKSHHQVAINFFSVPMVWHDTIDNYLLVSPVNGEKNEDGILTHMVQLQPFLSIYSLKKEKE